jgi:hypothetical protein
MSEDVLKNLNAREELVEITERVVGNLESDL